MVLAAGALGTAAFGIVDGLKATAIGAAGFARLSAMLGPLKTALAKAYGNEFLKLLGIMFEKKWRVGHYLFVYFVPQRLRSSLLVIVKIGATIWNEVLLLNIFIVIEQDHFV